MNNIHKSWDYIFKHFDFDLDELEETSQDIIYPTTDCIFRVFEKNINDIRVVIVGKEPYCTHNMSDGLCFSVKQGYDPPMLLQNIFKQIKSEYPERNYHYGKHNGSLINWLNREHIFLFNCALTVIRHKPLSHLGVWENFANNVLHFISKVNTKCVFLLIGKIAKQKEKYIINKDKVIYSEELAYINITSSSHIHEELLCPRNIFRKVEQKLGENINWSL